VRFFWDWKFRQAYERWLLAARSHPLRLHRYRYFSDAAMLIGEYEAAQRELDRGLPLLPDSPVLLASRAQVDAHRRDFVSMEKWARKLATLHPGLPTGHLLLARAVLLQGRLDQVEAHIEAARAPDHPGTLSVRARLRAYRGGRRGAELLLARPQLAKTPSVAGAIYAILGDHRKAEEHFTRALQRKDPGLPYFLADSDPQLAGNAWLRAHAALLGIKRG
jgi:tetratricopeptide (TPR) repeat protein